jgi:hypothetical protein
VISDISGRRAADEYTLHRMPKAMAVELVSLPAMQDRNNAVVVMSRSAWCSNTTLR